MRPPAGGSMEENPNNGDERVSTVYINRDGAESIQWNWKLLSFFITNWAFSLDSNPFNGIERGEGFGLPLVEAGSESIQWNWKEELLDADGRVARLPRNPFNGIESTPSPRRLPLRPSQGIHSMELKVPLASASSLASLLARIHSMELKGGV